MSADTIERGDFFRCSWGYDQTNTDFYEVLEVSASGKTIKVRQVDTAVVSESGPSTRVAPVAGSAHRWNPEVLVKHPRRGFQGEWGFKVTSYSTARLWDGVPAYETAQGWGH